MNIPEIQKQIMQNKTDHGFNVSDVGQEFLYLYGEASEAYSAYSRKKPREELGSELADTAIYLLGIAEMLHFDLEQEILNKMAINKRRIYKELPTGEIVKIEPDINKNKEDQI